MPPSAPLLLTNEPHLRDDLARLAAAAGVQLQICTDPDAGLRAWAGASLVLIGADLVEALAALAPSRREQVYVVARADPPDRLFRAGLVCGADAVLTVPGSDARVADLLSDSADEPRAAGTVVAVIGGAGGAGTTTFATALAVELGERDHTLLVDGDRLGAGVDRVLGIDDAPGARWDVLARPVGRLGARALRDGLPRRGDLSVLTWPADRSVELSGAAVRDVLIAARRAFPVVVLDLPRYPDPVAAELLARSDHVLLVTRLTLSAVSSAARVAAGLPSAGTSLVLRGRHARTVAETERILGLPVAAVMADQAGLDEAVGLGLGPLRARRGPLRRAVRRVASEVLGTRGARS